MTQIVTGSTAPEFSLQGTDGKQYSLQELTQKGPVLAAFFKVSCPVCQFTFPFFQRLYKIYGGEGVTFLGISQDDARATKEFAREHGITFPIAVDEKGYPASNAYGLTIVPTIFLIDTDGTVKTTSVGFRKKDLEGIAGDLATRRKITTAPLFRSHENIPAYKPG
jgi:peroxiredoxin